MKKQLTIEKTLGKLHIYFKPKEKVHSTGFMSSLRSRQLYRMLIKYAEEERLRNVSIYQVHTGCLIQKKECSKNIDLENQNSGICVELIDEKNKLKIFCQKYAELLEGRTIIFKKVEFWEIK